MTRYPWFDVMRLVAASFLLLLAHAGAAASPAPTLGALANATYPGLFDDPVTLRHGRWTGAPYVDGAASRPGVTLLPGLRIAGDLDADGAPEAVVMLVVSTGGTGTFKHIAVASKTVNDDVTVRAVASLGDRVRVRYARIESGELLIDTIEVGEGDAACCPGTKRLRRWRLVDDTLREATLTETGRLGPGDLGGGITWHLTHFDHDTRVRSVVSPTLVYEDGRIVGFAGCNRYFGPVTAGRAPGELTIGPLGTTRKTCAPQPMDVESEFLRLLAGTENFTFLGGRLALGYRDGERAGQLLFVAGD